MASLLAVQLRKKVEAFLGRGLKPGLVWKCEELIINFKPWVPQRYLEGLSENLENTRVTMRNWGIFYFPLYAMAKSFRGFARRDTFYFLKGSLAGLYQRCDLMAGDGFGEKDLSAILFLANECTNPEIEIAFTTARITGLRTIRHLRGIILANRARAVLPHPESLGMEEGPGRDQALAVVSKIAAQNYPDVSALDQLYKFRIINAKNRRVKIDFLWDRDHLNDSTEVDDEPAE